MGKSITFVSLLALGIFPSLAFGVSINISAGQQRGGLGDIASNIRMGQKLRAYDPSSQVNIIVDGTNSPHVATLLGSAFDPWKDHQIIDGVHYYRSAAAPKADVIMIFSSIPRQYHDNFMRTAPLGMVFQEYGRGDNFEVASGTVGLEGVESKPPIADKAVNNVTVRYQSGAQRGGFYFLPEKSTPPLSWAETAKKLKLDPTLPLGFAYTAAPEKTVEYLNALTKAYPDPSKPIQVVVRDFPALDKLKLPAHIHLVRGEGYAFPVAESLIAHSTLPIMITGDVSLTLALDYEKPFFYELNTWKKESIKDLTESLHTNGVTNLELQKSLLGLKKMNQDQMAAFFHDSAAQANIQKATAALRKTESLPVRTYQYISTLLALDPRLLSEDSIRDLSILVEKHGTPEAAVKSILDSFKNGVERGKWHNNLRTLASLNVDKYPELPHWLEQISHNENSDISRAALQFIDYRKSEPGWIKASKCLPQALFGAKH